MRKGWPFFRFLLAGAVLLILAEVALTLYYQRKNEPDYNREFIILPESPYVYRRAPYSETFNQAGKIRINNFSMRRKTDISTTPPDQTRRILAYGDSITHGHEVGDDEHYPYLLEQLLNQHSWQKYEVLNVCRGSSPSIYAMHLKRDIIQFKPHQVIVEIELTNDLSDEAIVRHKGFDKDNLPDGLTRARWWPNWWHLPPEPLNKNFWQRRKIYTFLRRRYWILTRKFGFFLSAIKPNPLFSTESNIYYFNMGFDQYLLTEKRLSESFEKMFQLIKAMQKYCAKHEADFLLIIMPCQYVFYPNQYRDGSIELLAKAEAKARELAIPYFGLREALAENGGESLYMDFCHPTAKGYQIMAATLAKYYKKNGQDNSGS